MEVSGAPDAGSRPDGAARADGKRWVPFDEYWKGKRVHLKRGRLYSWRYRKAARAFNKKLRDAKPTIGRDRERRFVVAFARRIAVLARAGRGSVKRAELAAAASSAAWDAGYRAQHARHGRRLMNLPRIQAAVNEAFDKAGFTIEQAATELAGIAKNVEVAPEVRIRAIDLRFRLTTGLAVTPVVGKMRHEHSLSDKLFDESQMHNALPVEPVAITGGTDNADNARTPAGDQKAARVGAVGKERKRKPRRDDAA